MRAKILAMLKKWGPWALAVVIGIPLMVTIPRACRMVKAEKKAAALAGENTVLKRDALAAAKEYVEKSKEAEEKIGELNGAIDSAYTIIAALQGDIGAAEGKIGDLGEELKSAKTDAERVPILEKIVGQYQIEVFTLKRTVEEKDKIIFALTDKYKVEYELRLSCESQVGDWKTYAEGKEREAKALRSANSSLKARYALTKGIGAAEAVVVVLLLTGVLGK